MYPPKTVPRPLRVRLIELATRFGSVFGVVIALAAPLNFFKAPPYLPFLIVGGLLLSWLCRRYRLRVTELRVGVYAKDAFLIRMVSGFGLAGLAIYSAAVVLTVLDHYETGRLAEVEATEARAAQARCRGAVLTPTDDILDKWGSPLLIERAGHDYNGLIVRWHYADCVFVMKRREIGGQEVYRVMEALPQ